jgi:ankyrin repeat protein
MEVKIKNKWLEEDSSDEEVEIKQVLIHETVKHGTNDEIIDACKKDRIKVLCTKDMYGRTPIYYAASHGKTVIMEWLARRGSDVNAKDGDERTPLFGAAVGGHTETCDALVDLGASVKFRDSKCRTVLHEAVAHNHVETSMLLIERGCDLAASEVVHGRTVLHVAAEKGYTLMCDKLIGAGADLMSTGDSLYSKTPLHLACLFGHTDVANVLIRRHAEINILSGLLDKSPLHLACEQGHHKTAEVLVLGIREKKADLEFQGVHTNGSTAMHLACQYNHLETAKLLFENGANLFTLGMFTTIGTCLHIACQYGNPDIVRYLCEQKIDVEMKDQDGLTCLHTACKYQKYDCAFILIEFNADLSVKSKSNKFPTDLVTYPPICDDLHAAGKEAADERNRIRAAELAKIAAGAAEAERQRRLKWQREQEEDRLRIKAEMAKSRFKKLLRAAADLSGELSSVTDLAAEFTGEDINVFIFEEERTTALIRAVYREFETLVVALLQCILNYIFN